MIGPTIDAPRCQPPATPPPKRAQMRRIILGGVGREAQRQEADEHEAEADEGQHALGAPVPPNAKPSSGRQPTPRPR